MSKEFFTIDQVAAKLGVHPKTVRRYISGGRMAAQKIAGSWRISPKALTAFFNACGNSGGAQQQNQSEINLLQQNGNFDLDQKIQARTVVDYRVTDEGVAREMLKEVMTMIAEHSLDAKKSRFSFEYGDSDLMRLNFLGSPSYIHAVMTILKKYQ